LISIRQDDLVRLALDHLHPVVTSQFQDHRSNAIDPTAMCWKVGSEGILMHSFDFHPLVIHPRSGPPAADRVDHPLLGRLGFGLKEISIVRDSRAYAQCRLVEDDAPHPLQPGGDVSIAKWAALHTGVFQRLLFRNQMRLIATEQPSALWDEVGTQASAAVLRILGALAQIGPQARSA
jgi:hypothetical protein